ncbi:uncharacterized protein LOC117921020 isoform X2 [Vitis riparia]|uniref:uncharacterized protein LOC117921020 isoform X2 n=1 Tax=Vitis riparia TaxID=96939 RepID=UPI00155B248B|nr:uncharacterized protein LOC117921020 isoform X2 [Vitis riparia]
MSGMAEEEQPSNPIPPPPSSHQPLPPFVEVMCKSSGRTRRFAAGTEAGFAIYLINKKLDIGLPLALHIEAVKEGEEPVSFGPNAVLVDYGDGWKLETVTDVEFAGVGKEKRVQPTEVKIPKSSGGSHPSESAVSSQPVISFVYIGKIFLAIIFIFALGAVFTLALENLPRLILFINSSM